MDFILHLDKKLNLLITNYGLGAYLILFLIVFAETGLVITPFLPGDSLLFMAGLLSGQPGGFDVGLLIAVFILAALCGDNCNYLLGMKLGRRLFRNEKSKFFNRAHLDRTHEFFEKHGGKTVVIARFLPIFRTFAPFVAGMGKMSYRKFITYSFLAALLWVGICVLAGNLLGRNHWVKDNFLMVLTIMVVLTAIPGVREIWKHAGPKKKTAAVEVADEEREPVAAE